MTDKRRTAAEAVDIAMYVKETLREGSSTYGEACSPWIIEYLESIKQKARDEGIEEAKYIASQYATVHRVSGRDDLLDRLQALKHGGGGR